MSFLAIGVGFALAAFLLTRRIGATILAFLLGWWGSYVVLPTLDWGFYDLPMMVAALGVLLLACEVIRAVRMKDQAGARLFAAASPLAVAAVCFAAAGVATLPALHAEAYHGLLGEVRESVYSSDTAPVEVAQIRVVDQALARRLAEKRLGENTALGSQVEVGTMRIQQVGDQLYWVGPLGHSGFFKWLLNRSGTPGYVMVSATNERDVRLVEQVGGQPIALRYNQGAYFGDEPRRRIYRSGYLDDGLWDVTFEIDDEGRPYWVVTLIEKRVGFGGADAAGVVVLDAQTGDVAEYGPGDAPAWIDRIQPEEVVIDQLDAWGRYVHGWWNPSNLDQLESTPGTSLVYGQDGRSYWYTGLTSVGSDNATVGFVLVDTRTKDVRFYKQTGATEIAAMGSAEGSVQETGYAATFPVLYNVSGRPTYFMTLKDDAGLVKNYAFVSVENYQIVGIGDDVAGALRSYRRSLASRGNSVTPDGAVTYETAIGRIARITAETRQGDTYYYLLVEGAEHVAFVGSSGVSIELPLSQVGDTVRIAYENGGGSLADIMEFDNAALAFQSLDESDRQLTAEGDTVRVAERSARSVTPGSDSE